MDKVVIAIQKLNLGKTVEDIIRTLENLPGIRSVVVSQNINEVSFEAFSGYNADKVFKALISLGFPPDLYRNRYYYSNSTYSTTKQIQNNPE